jgi:hypothetical protein
MRFKRLNSMFALRSFLDAGIPCTMSLDYPARKRRLKRN